MDVGRTERQGLSDRGGLGLKERLSRRHRRDARNPFPTAYRRTFSHADAEQLYCETLFGVRRDGPRRTPLEPEVWSELITAVERDRLVVPFAARADELLKMTVEQRKYLRDRSRRVEAARLRLEWARIDAAASLDGRVKTCVIKGFAAGKLLYSASSLRQATDLDVLIAGDQIEMAHVLLEQSGNFRRIPLQGAVTEEHSHAWTYVHRGGGELDLHREVRGVLPGVNLRLEDAEPILLYDGTGYPKPEFAVVSAMLHLSTGRPGNFGLAPANTLQDLVCAHQRDGGTALYETWPKNTLQRLTVDWALNVVKELTRFVHGDRCGEHPTASVAAFDVLLRLPGFHAVSRRLGHRASAQLFEAALVALRGRA